MIILYAHFWRGGRILRGKVMKKILAAILILLIALAAVSEVILPRTVTNILQEQIIKATHAQEVTLNLQSFPNAKILAGFVDKVYATANNAEIGELEFQALTLNGEKLNIDISEIISPTQNLNDKQRTDKILKSAGHVELSGIVTEEGLKNFVEKKVDELNSATIKITPQEITATGQFKLLGRMADVDVSGNFILMDDAIYFHVTKLDVRNTLVRNVQLNSYLGDIKVLESSQLPIGLKFNSLQMSDGEILITAVR